MSSVCLPDAYGDHQVGCGGNGDRIHRHDSIRDALFSAAQTAALAPRRGPLIDPWILQSSSRPPPGSWAAQLPTLSRPLVVYKVRGRATHQHMQFFICLCRGNATLWIPIGSFPLFFLIKQYFDISLVIQKYANYKKIKSADNNRLDPAIIASLLVQVKGRDE